MNYSNVLKGTVAACMLALPVQMASAEGLSQKAQESGLKVAFFNFQPYSYEGEDGTLTGTDVDTLRAVLEAMDATIDTAQATEWGALIPGLRAGRFDVVAAGMFVTPERCAQVTFSEPIFGIPQTLVVLKDNPNGITGYEDVAAKGLTIAVLAGSAQAAHARDAGVEEAKIMEIPDNATAIAAMRAGRADAYGLATPGGRNLVAGVPEQDFEMIEPFSEVAGKNAMAHGAFAFRQEDAAFVEEFNKILTSRIEDGSHVAVLEAHGMDAAEMPLLSTAELCGG